MRIRVRAFLSYKNKLAVSTVEAPKIHEDIPRNPQLAWPTEILQ